MNPVGFSFALTIADRNCPFSASTLRTAKISSASFRNASMSPILRSVSYFSIRAGGLFGKSIRPVPKILTTRREASLKGRDGCCALHEQENAMESAKMRSSDVVRFTTENIAGTVCIRKQQPDNCREQAIRLKTPVTEGDEQDFATSYEL